MLAQTLLHNIVSATQRRSVSNVAMCAVFKIMTAQVARLLDRFEDIHNLFSDLTQQERQALEKIALVKQLAAGKEIARVSEPVDGLYLVIDGKIRVESLTKDGKYYSVGTLPRGDVHGLISALDEQPSLHYAWAVTETTSIVIPPQAVRELVYRNAAFNAKVIQCLCKRGRMSFAINDRFALAKSAQRVAQSLLALFAGEHSLDAPASLEGEIKINQQELSSMLALSRMTVNRTLKDLERRGLLILGYNRVRINDLEGLRGFAQNDGKSL